MWEPSFKRKCVVLDTCILQYLDKTSLKDLIFKILDKLIENNNTIRVSDYSSYELFCGCKKEKEVVLALIWRKFNRYVVNTKVLQAAAHLSTFYGVKNGCRHIGDGDKIIGATAFLTKSLIFTANFNDFPRPFFSEKEKIFLKYKKRGKTIPLLVYFLKPEVEIIADYIKRRR